MYVKWGRDMEKQFNMVEEVREYLELFDSPANGFGQHVHPMYGQSHLMLRYLYNEYGDKAVRMEIDNQLRNRRCRILSKG